MTVRLVTALGLFAFSSTAFAAADLVPTISGPTTAVYVGQTGRYTVKVSNTGNANTTNGSVVIDLPETNTSPTVYVMGTVVAKSSVCSQSGTTLTCNIGGIRRGKNVSVYVDLQLPESADPLVIDARVSNLFPCINKQFRCLCDQRRTSNLEHADFCQQRLALGALISWLVQCFTPPGQLHSRQ